jgi:hypothetical protein
MTDILSVSATTKKPRRKKPAKSGIPYETATSTRSQDETKKLGLHSFETAFMPYMLTSDGRPLHERVSELQLLPQPEQQQKVIPLARP